MTGNRYRLLSFVLTQAVLYMEQLPEERRPVTGTQGALYRRRQLMRQLPSYDQDPSKCHGLPEAELRAMALFVKAYKEEALGVAEVALPGEGGAARDDAAKQKNGKAGQDTQEPNSPANGMPGKKGEYVSGAGLWRQRERRLKTAI